MSRAKSVVVNGVSLRVGDRVRFTALPKHCDEEYAEVYENLIRRRRSKEIKMISYGKALVFVRVLKPHLTAIYTLPIDGQDDNWVKVKRRLGTTKGKAKASSQAKSPNQKKQRSGWVSGKIVGYLKPSERK